MSIAEKFGRWFVFGLWILAGSYCLLNAAINVKLERDFQLTRIFDLQDAEYAAAGVAFLAAAFLLARRHRWARPVSLAL